MRPLTDAERLAGICPACRRQPCACSYFKNPAWVEEILKQLDPIADAPPADKQRN